METPPIHEQTNGRSEDHLSRPRAQRLTLSVTEAAEALGIGRATAYECVKTGELPSIKIGGRILIPTKLLNDLLIGEGGDDGHAA